eukprot:CAMPEP_0198120938 /NCGR_PEP_ID=MMETSP1442-20131203/30740_1 /TAXON_ID= /ORGANISM="Craspedostauros australis, Strain CCMP3328" /LENGTH=65 /DNA_ID=CAMNT_0043779673 /DNA_START=296 /DNA_END=489 /DNA_ORIENTATION=-
MMHLLEQAIHWNNEGALLLSSGQVDAGKKRLELSLCTLRKLLRECRTEEDADDAILGNCSDGQSG